MTSLLTFAFRSLARRPATAALLAFGLGVAIGLPFAVGATAAEFERTAAARAAAAPLVLGAAGGPTELVTHALYFRPAPPGGITVADARELDRGGLATVAPLLVRGTAGGRPVVGTDAEYFKLRGLRLAAGGPIRRLGDCVVGASAARGLEIGAGDKVATDPADFFGLSGGVPVRLSVAGVLAPTGTADDDAVFVSLETAWLIAGLGHAHANPAAAHSEGVAPDAAGGFVEVTDENADRFHFHGRRERFLLTAALVAPRDVKARLLLLGRFLDRKDGVQLAEADEVLDALFAVAVRVRRLFLANAATAGLGTALLAATVVALTVRLRADEVRTMTKLGLSRGRIAALFATEFGLVLAAAAAVAVGLTSVAREAAPTVLRWLVV